MLKLHHSSIERKIKYINLDHKDIFDEDYKKVNTWFGVFNNIMTVKIRNKIVDTGSGNRSREYQDVVAIKGLKNE